MQAKAVWKEKMKLSGEAGGHALDLDAKPPFGDASGFTPKELVAIGICGCTALDVVALLKKHKQPLESLEVSAEVTSTEKTQPTVFKEVILTFTLQGELDPGKIMEAVRLSQSQYCGVSAMIAKTSPIRYRVLLNGSEIGTGTANFAGESSS